MHPAKHSTVMVADSYEDTRFLLKQWLEAEGYGVVEARNGQEAVELTRDQRPDLILMSERMPVLGGVEAARRIGRIIVLILVATWSFSQAPVALAHQTRPQSQADQRERDAKGLKEFQEEVAEYVELRRRLDSKLPPLPPKAPPESVHAYQADLLKLLVAKRARSKEGDLFVREVRPLLRRLIREILAGPGGRALRAEIYDEAPGRTFRININTPYPSVLPLSTVPYRLLRVLPPLPVEIQYRIVGRDLVLLDIDAQMVVDVLRNVVPL